MQEKDMVNDVLSMVKGSLAGYANMISETANPQLRQTLQQMRNGDEKYQYDLFQIAEQKGYYQPAGQATASEIQQVKSQTQS